MNARTLEPLDHKPMGSEAGLPPEPSFVDALSHPAGAFMDPKEVLDAPHLPREAKRAILASWASDVWAVESRPALRHCPGLTGCTVPLDSILAALQRLDGEREDRPARGTRGPVRWLAGRRREN